MNRGEALLWGTLIVAVLFAALATSYFLIRYFIFDLDRML
jgi:hypothetical protein